MNTMVYALVAGLSFVLAWWLRGSRLKAHHERALAEKNAMLDILRADSAASLAQLEHALTEAITERDKSSRYFLKITEFEQERDRIQVLYTRHAIGHGNAQQLMMNTIETLVRQLQAKGVRAQIPKVLHVVREEYQANYEVPARAAAEAIAKAQGAAPPAAETP